MVGSPDTNESGRSAAKRAWMLSGLDAAAIARSKGIEHAAVQATAHAVSPRRDRQAATVRCVDPLLNMLTLRPAPDSNSAAAAPSSRARRSTSPGATTTAANPSSMVAVNGHTAVLATSYIRSQICCGRVASREAREGWADALVNYAGKRHHQMDACRLPRRSLPVRCPDTAPARSNLSEPATPTRPCKGALRAFCG